MKATAILLLLGASAAARAGPTIEIEPRSEAFATRAACEQALEQRHSAAKSRLASDPKGAGKVGRLERDGEKHLSYVETVDLGAADSEMPGSQTEQFTCRGSMLEHRIEFGAR